MLWPLRRIPVDLQISHGDWNYTQVQNGTLEHLKAFPSLIVLGRIGSYHWVLFNPFLWRFPVNTFCYKGESVMFIWHNSRHYLTFNEGKLATDLFKKE